MAIGLVERSLSLNPSFARGWLFSGVLRNFAGQPDLAIEHIKTSLRLSPCNRTPGPGLGAAHFFKRRSDEAAAFLLASLEQAPSFAMTYRLLRLAMRTWDGSTKQERSPSGCVPLPRSWC